MKDSWMDMWLASSLFDSYFKQFRKYVPENAKIFCNNPDLTSHIEKNYDMTISGKAPYDAYIYNAIYATSEVLFSNLEAIAQDLGDKGLIFLILFIKSADLATFLDEVCYLKKHFIVCEEYRDGKNGYFLYLQKRTIK